MAEHIELSLVERELQQKEIESERFLQEAREALERAARIEAPWGGYSPETEEAFADFFFGRWKEARAAKDPVLEQVLRSSVESWDQSGKYTQALLGRGTLTVNVTPVAAQVYLFRYEPYETVRLESSVIPCQVPVPTEGIGRVKDGSWTEDFYPGDLCLKVIEVEEHSIAEEAGLRRGDLVIRLNGSPCGEGCFVQEVAPGSPADQKGIEPLARIDSMDGIIIDCYMDWLHAGEGENWKVEHIHRLAVGGMEVEARCKHEHEKDAAPWQDIFGITLVNALDLIHHEAPQNMSLLCLHEGEPITLPLSEKETSGLVCEVTAYPLILSPLNRIQAEEPLTVDPGSYLLLIRCNGYEDQRYPLLVPHEEKVVAKVELLEEGTTPPGFVYIPPGPFIYGGDPKAFQPERRQVKDIEGFFIAAKEVTNEEWFEFVNDEETLKKIEENEEVDGQRYLFLPRQMAGLLSIKTEDGRWEPLYGPPQTPVMGISMYEVYCYCKWLNKKAREAGSRWKYDLPDGYQWEKAARGVDGRYYPWGDRFDFSLSLLKNNKPYDPYNAPGGFEPRDRSPFDVLDMCGSRCEWTREELAPRTYFFMRGGSWTTVSSITCRAASRTGRHTTWLTTDNGFRLIAFPRR